MNGLRSRLRVLALPMATVGIIGFGIMGCGRGRHLQSVTLSPASADAQDFANGQVSFTATGVFSKPPLSLQLTNKDVTWCAGSDGGACVGQINPGVAVDENGVAQCVPGFTGTATILAGTPSQAAKPDRAMQLKIFGAAQLTCP